MIKKMFFRMDHILPYKVGKVSFVPNTSGIISGSREVVISSAMSQNNKIELISLKQSNLQHEASKSVPDAISDMKWVS